jgi:hypothetical protein
VSMNYEAVPCRACGSEPVWDHESDDDGGVHYVLGCPKGCSIGGGSTEDKAILDWNREQEGRAEP